MPEANPGTIEQQLQAHPQILTGLMTQALRQLPFPISPNLRLRLTGKITLSRDQFEQVVPQTLQQIITDQQLTLQDSLDTASLAAIAELWPQLTPGSVAQKTAPTPAPMTPEQLAGLSETPIPTPGPTTATSAPAAAPDQIDQTGIANLPPSHEAGAFQMFGGAAPERAQAVQQYGQEKLAEQLAPSEQKPEAKPEQAAQEQARGENEIDLVAALQARQQQDRMRGLLSQRAHQAAQQMLASADDAGMPSDDPDRAELARLHGTAGATGGTQQSRLSHKAISMAGERLGRSIQAKIRGTRFEGFFAALLMAILKDGLDWLDPSGLLPFFINLFVTGALAAIINSEGIWFRRMIVQRFLGEMIIAAIAEFVPGFDLFPTYTISILLMKAASDKAMSQQRQAYDNVAEAVAGLKKARLPAPPQT